MARGVSTLLQDERRGKLEVHASPPLERVLLYYSKGVQCFLSSAGVIRPVLSSNRLDDEEIVLKFKIHRGDTVSSAFGRNNPLFLSI